MLVDDLPGYPVECQQKQTIHLWRFLKELLLQPERYDRYIRWVNRQEGIFKIEDSPKVAKLWGKRKNRPAMNYDKLSRSIRQYYRKGIIKKTANSKRLVYQFCPAYLWFFLYQTYSIILVLVVIEVNVPVIIPARPVWVIPPHIRVHAAMLLLLTPRGNYNR